MSKIHRPFLGKDNFIPINPCFTSFETTKKTKNLLLQLKSSCNMIKTLGSPFKFFGYYYLNRSSIRHANPINDVRFQRLVITIFGVTGLFLKGTTFQSVFFYLLVLTEKGCLSFLNCSWSSFTDNFVHIRRK